MASRKQQKLLRYVEEGSVLKLKSYLRKHRSVNLNFAARKGRTPLHLACALLDDAVVHLLLKHGASPLNQDHRGNTALHVAAKKAACNGKRVYEDLVVPLKRHSPAAMNITNHAGKTPGDLLKGGNAEQSPAPPPWDGEDKPDNFRGDEEQAFRAKLFGECMDEYQEVFGQYDDDFARTDPEPENHFDWAERMAREYDRKRQSTNPTHRAKAAAAAKKEQREKEQQELRRRLEEEHRQYQQRASMLREELTRSKKHQYERRCATVFSHSASHQLRYRDIPWPGGSAGSIEDMIGVITHGVDVSDQSAFRSYLRRQQALWHPDRFQQRCGTRLDETERQHILDTVMALSQRLNKLAEDAK
ncbi:NF-kappa-B inhibitor-like protein 1 [Ambystoma mexicanum]|uniref:NF-kappa-B inhibitor-like protein 1 n=1 Tax=Ambystoma mexicanum TaxID=8296 RepID=UPI0037E73BE9